VSKPKILIVSLGGTITMTVSTEGGITPTLTAENLIDSVPQLANVASLEATTRFSLPGASLSQEQLVEVACLLRQKFSEDFDGAVVVQGTDTIEDTAFVLDLLVGTDKPVVVTGAMRGPQSPGADGPANLLSAVTVASNGSMRGLGVCVVLNDEIHAARWVQKSHSAFPSAFESPGTGRIGVVTEGRVELFMTPKRSLPLVDLSRLSVDIPKVAQVSLGLGEDGRILLALKNLGYSGAIVEGMGAGHIPASAVGAVSSLITHMPVVLCSRVRSGRVFSQTYGFSGSEIDLLKRGVLSGGHLNASKARHLLALLLGSQVTEDNLAASFELVSQVA
jgi:L-asparaginase